MSQTWTTEQIVALAPDEASAKAGKGLAGRNKWVSVGQNERALWGECQGSGSSPYQTKIDLSEPAFSCSCPSRKFPCKHGLGLFLLFAAQPNAFETTAPPAWVTDWLAKREATQQRKQEQASKPKEEIEESLAAQQKRAAQREKRVTTGLEALDLWLRDLVRLGLASVQNRPPSFWEEVAKRLVDAQAPGAARLVREMATIPATGSGWDTRLMERIGLLSLLMEGYQRLETLPAPVQADIRNALGWNLKQEDLLAETGVTDHWIVLGQRTIVEDRLTTRRTWFCGKQTKRPVLILQFAIANQPLEAGFPHHTEFEAEMVFYPSNYPLRALVKQRFGMPQTSTTLPGSETLNAFFTTYAAALAQNPWLEAFPATLLKVVPVQRNNAWFLRDREDNLLPITPTFHEGWQLMAISGGHPVHLFGEWDGHTFLPLSYWLDLADLHQTVTLQKGE